jgi:hypothetical protein
MVSVTCQSLQLAVLEQRLNVWQADQVFASLLELGPRLSFRVTS